MGTIHPATSQLTLNLELGLSQRHTSLRSCMAAGVYGIGLDRVAVKLDESPSKLSEKLAGGTGDRKRDVGLDAFERYLEKTGDFTPIYYLIDRFLRDSKAQQQEALARLPGLIAALESTMRAAGVERAA